MALRWIIHEEARLTADARLQPVHVGDAPGQVRGRPRQQTLGQAAAAEGSCASEYEWRVK